MCLCCFSSETCSHAFHKWVVKHRQKSNSQCASWEAAAPRRRHAAKLAKLLVLKHGER